MADNFEEQKIKLTFDTNAKQAAGDTNALGASIEHVEQAQTEANDTFKTFKTQLREANAELQKSIQLYGETSEQTVKAAKAVANLKDQMGFAKDLSENFNPDQKMKALGAATQVAGTAMQGMTAGMALFGSESADTQKQLLKVQAAMAFSDAISQMSNLGDQWKLLKATISSSTIATKANAAATGAAAMIQNLFTGSVNASGAGFKALKIAIASTGIGLLIVGLAMVVTNFQKIKDVVLKAVPGLAAVGDTIMSIVNAVTDFIGVTSEADRAADKLKTNAENRSKEIDKILKEDGSRYSESAKKKMAIEKQLQDDLAEGIYNEKKLRKEAAFAKAQIDKENAENAAKAKKDAEDKADAEAEKRKKDREDKAKKEEEKRLQKIKADAQKAYEIDQQAKQDMADIEAKKKEEQEDKNKKEEEAAQTQTDVLKSTYDEQKALDLMAFNDKKNQKEALMSLGESALAGAKDLFGKNKKVQKGIVAVEGAVALGKLATNTVEAVGKDNATSPTTLGMPWSGIHIGMGVLGAASIISNTNKQLQALGGGSIAGGSTPNFSGGGGTPQSQPTVAFNNTAENQIGQSINKAAADNPPLKVYVAESDISDAQKNVKVLVSKNTI